MNTTNPVTQSTITQGLARLGIQPTTHLMVHASLSRFGLVTGGAHTVVAALRQAAGPNGAVIIPSFRDAIRSENYALQQCAHACPQSLCPSNEPGCTGIIGETVRQQPDSIRSCPPTPSWVGVGAAASHLLDGHHQSQTPCGHDSPFIRLMQHDGQILLLGVGINTITNFHVIEDALNVPYLSAIDPPRRHATYTTSSRRIQYTYPHLLHETLAAARLIQCTTIGAATCHAINARAFGSFLYIVAADDPWCFALRPSRDTYNPERDAQQKTQRMSHAWAANPDPAAWQKLIDASAAP
ncbi:MAG: hypothetical protein CMJ49_00740, partial [Planctomycetaceae bacterium]|nr:hypothetical protein [Planctomycetaceae bacterium]